MWTKLCLSISLLFWEWIITISIIMCIFSRSVSSFVPVISIWWFIIIIFIIFMLSLLYFLPASLLGILFRSIRIRMSLLYTSNGFFSLMRDIVSKLIGARFGILRLVVILLFLRCFFLALLLWLTLIRVWLLLLRHFFNNSRI